MLKIVLFGEKSYSRPTRLIHKLRCIKSLFCFLLACVSMVLFLEPRASAQQKSGNSRTNTERLLELATAAKARLEAGRGSKYLQMLRNPTPPQAVLNRHPDIQLIQIDSAGRPVYFRTCNINAADTISTDQVWPGGIAGYSLTGSGIDFLGIWDAEAVFHTHQELTGRVTQIDIPPGNTHPHATHVAGTMIASGFVPAAKGMAYQADLKAYDWVDVLPEMALAAIDGMKVCNHSWGIIAGWEGSGDWFWFGSPAVSAVEDYQFGFYSDDSLAWDEIADNAPELLIVKAAGNNRDDVGPPPGVGHYVWEVNNWVWSMDTRDDDGGTGIFARESNFLLSHNPPILGIYLSFYKSTTYQAPKIQGPPAILAFHMLAPRVRRKCKPG